MIGSWQSQDLNPSYFPLISEVRGDEFTWCWRATGQCKRSFVDGCVHSPYSRETKVDMHKELSRPSLLSAFFFVIVVLRGETIALHSF